MLRRHAMLHLAALVAATLVLDPHAAHAQRPALELGSPTGEPGPASPTPATETEATESGEPEIREPENGATETPAPAEELVVPEPPGSHAAAETETRYPIPTPGAEDEDEEPRIRIPSRITTRLRSLDANLQALAARGGSNIVNAVLALVTGGLAITLGAVRPNPVDEMSIYLYLYGGTAAARGVLEFALSPDAQGAAIRYQHMPMNTREEVRARLEYGEAALAGLAEQSLIARVLDASLNLAVGVAVVPIFAAKDFSITDPLDYFVLIGAGVAIVSGIITLASTSAAEQRWSAYQELRERLGEEEEAAGEDDARASVEALDAHLLRPAGEPTVRFGLAGTPSGGLASLALTF